MTVVENGVARQIGQGIEGPAEVQREFCLGAVGTMCRFYGVTKSDFEQKLKEGYTEISFGRGPLGWSDKKTAEYIVSFAAFAKKDHSKIETFEVRKEMATFASASKGLSNKKYSPDKYQKTIDRFKLFLNTEDLAGFIQRFNWPKQ
jgi:hypothetical protein